VRALAYACRRIVMVFAVWALADCNQSTAPPTVSSADIAATWGL
jgi:hypothetical protein